MKDGTARPMNEIAVCGLGWMKARNTVRIPPIRTHSEPRAPQRQRFRLRGHLEKRPVNAKLLDPIGGRA